MARYIFLDGQVFNDGTLYVSTLRKARRSLEASMFLVITPIFETSNPQHAEDEKSEEVDEHPE